MLPALETKAVIGSVSKYVTVGVQRRLKSVETRIVSTATVMVAVSVIMRSTDILNTLLPRRSAKAVTTRLRQSHAVARITMVAS